MLGATGGGEPIRDVREGMRVVDSAGDEVGTVSQVRMSDPGSATTEGQGMGRSSGLVGAVADAFVGGGGLPEQEQERLVRLGFVRIDAGGVFSGDRYAASDEIAAVTQDAVQLSVARDRLVG
ncbi:hypothetical protein [uncultured Cellulomonas sp.]|uniref:hypothetical protein n=1 Tax=uncultured Cellulomonas sp. TaxID=189682 RepID=UPI00260D23D2|nr:hypothetical protein [uncultured Cellulomonas sp.]